MHQCSGSEHRLLDKWEEPSLSSSGLLSFTFWFTPALVCYPLISIQGRKSNPRILIDPATFGTMEKHTSGEGMSEVWSRKVDENTLISLVRAKDY
jgi:hypothetical protein